MIPEMTPQQIANEIGARQIYCRVYGEGETFVMVEGKTDQVLWEEYRSEQDSTLYPTKGRDRLVAALKICRTRGYRGIAGIVDLDYWLITGSDELDTGNLLYDDCHPDMESILLSSPALRKVVRHSIAADDIEQLHDFADKLVLESQRLAMEFGYFRLLNHLNDYGLRCNAIRFEEVIDKDTLKLDCEWIAKRLAENKAGISSEDLLKDINELRKEYPPDNTQLCRGKDVLAIMAYVLPILCHSEFGEDLSQVSIAAFCPEGLSKDLRLAYEFGYFMQTSLYRCIKNWECANSSYKILKPEI